MSGVKTPIDAGVIARVVRGVRYIVTGSQDWFGPGNPIQPQAQEVVGRQLDYPVGFNLRIIPRQEEAISFAQMRALADSYDLLRLVIETRKDQISKLEWTIKSSDNTGSLNDARIKEIKEFLKFPDQEHDWNTWIRAVLEDLFVLDAPTIYPRMTNGGNMYSLELIDGSTIKRVIDNTGRTPLPPDPAYQQILKGVPAVNYSRDELVYSPRNIRTHKIYGYSPVEQIIMTVNIALRRQIYQLNYYTEGNVPEALIGVPPEWNPDQIAQFQKYWDSLLEGDLNARRHAKFIPGGLAYQATKEPILKDEYDEWLARIVCFAFSVSPSPFVKQMNRATAQTQQEVAIEEGLAPVMAWIKSVINLVIWKYFGYKDLEFSWQEEPPMDPLEQAQVNDIYVRNGIKSVDEAREELGLNGIGMPNAVFTAVGPQLIDDILNPPDPVDVSPIQGQQPDQVAQKILKKKAIDPINRNRGYVLAMQAKLKRIIKRFLNKEAPRIASQVVSGYIKATKIDQEIIDRILRDLDFSGWALLTGDVEQILVDIAKDGGAKALAQIGISNADITTLVNDNAVQYAKDRAAEMVGKKWIDGDLIDNPDAQWVITDGTREMLRSTVTDAVENGWSNDQLANEIENSTAFSDSRAEMIARTETAYADVAGNMSAYRDSGAVSSKEWILGGDPCDICLTNSEAGAIGLDDVFPSGDDAPPAHPRCECDVLPVLTEDQ